MTKRKDRQNPCCHNPKKEYHSYWQDDTGKCANCGKKLRHGNGPLLGFYWPSGSIRGKRENKHKKEQAEEESRNIQLGMRLYI